MASVGALTRRRADERPTEPRRVPALPTLGSCLVLGWAFLLPVQVATGGALRIAPSDVLIACYAVLGAASLRRVPKAWSGWVVAVVLVIWWGLARAAMTPTGASRHAVLEKAIGILVLVVTFRCVVDYASTVERLRAVLRAFLYGGVVNAVLALVAFALERGGGASLPLVNAPYETSRVCGLLIDPNAFGGLVATALLLHLVCTVTGSPLLRGAWATTADLALPLALALTFSRSAWIGALLGLVAAAAVGPGVARGVARRLAPGIVLLPLVLLLLPGSAALAERPSQVTARVDIAGRALEDLRASPFDGIGLGVYEQRYGVIVHNTALWFLTEMGLVGLVVFLGFIVMNLRRAAWLVTRGEAPVWPVAGALLAAACVGLGLSVGIEAFYQRYWWMVFAAIAAAWSLARAKPLP